MQVISSISELRTYRRSLSPALTTSLVPTMGALHDGHIRLMHEARSHSDHVMATLFVNPTQFGPNEDFSRYPRTLDRDLELLTAAGVHAVFVPQTEEIYPAQSHFYIDITGLADRLCGKSRPGHMNGVVQVVSILFHLCQPDIAFFGRKDYQQLAILNRLAQEFHFPVTVRGVDTVREPDGLALSSRNRYLGPEERAAAPLLYQTLQAVKNSVWKSAAEAETWAASQIQANPAFRLDYFQVLNGRDLSPIGEIAEEQAPVAFVAAFLGTTRLIDNVALYSYPV